MLFFISFLFKFLLPGSEDGDEKLYSPETDSSPIPLPRSNPAPVESKPATVESKPVAEPEKKVSVERERKSGATAISDAYRVN